MTTHATPNHRRGKDAKRRHAVAEVELTENALIVHVRGMDRLWALKSRLQIPLSHVVGAEVDPEIAREWHKGLRAGGTHVPGVTTAGTFYQEGERVFWDVHDPEKTVVIQLRDERYARLVIEVEDPRATAATIQGRSGG
jgi:hypothetical protein